MIVIVQLSWSARTDGGVYLGRSYRSIVLCDKTAEVSIMKIAEQDRIIRVREVEVRRSCDKYKSLSAPGEREAGASRIGGTRGLVARLELEE